MRIAPGFSGAKRTVEGQHLKIYVVYKTKEVCAMSAEDIIKNSYSDNERIIKDGYCYVVLSKKVVKFAFRENGSFKDNGWTDVYAFMDNINNAEFDIYEIEGGYNIFTGERR